MKCEQQQLDKLEQLRGITGTHFDLANAAEALGFSVEIDPDDNERSEIKLMGCWNPDGSDIVVGEIIGDAQATIV